MNAQNHDPSIENEPHRRGARFSPDESEAKAHRTVSKVADKQTEDDRVEHSVWDEPGLSPQLAGDVPHDALTYAGWLERRIAETGFLKSWAVTALVALAAGPWAILAAFLGAYDQAGWGIINVTVIGPLMEEAMKVAAALWVVEKKPFLFLSRLQIGYCALAGGFVFAVIENLLYLHVYVPDPPPALVQWRWTVCVALHMGCSLIAGLGLMRIWSHTITTKTKPHLALGAPYGLTAVVIHASYNGFAVLLSMMKFHF